MSQDILVVAGVTREFPGFSLDQVSFSVPPGSVMGLLGPNGAGKTTTIKLILNFLRPHEGRITVCGMDSRADEIRIKARLGFVGEQTVLPPQTTARKLGDFLSICYPDWSQARYTGYLHRFGVPLDRPARVLSRGTRVKLSLAAAMGHRPTLLLLDEPTSGLDPVVRHEVVAALREVADEGDRAVLFSSHIGADLEAVADRVTILNQGQVLTTESTGVLLERWRRIVFSPGNSPVSDCRWQWVVAGEEGGRFTAVTDSFSPALAEALRESGADLAAEKLTLEEILRHTLARHARMR